MFAILETGGKQYKVEEGDILEVELINQNEISKQQKVSFSSVLLISDKQLHIGQPYVKNAKVEAIVLEEFKAPKVIVFKKKPKKQYKKTQGHRQRLHKIQIEKIAIEAKAAPPQKEEIPQKVDTPKKETTPKKAETPKKTTAPKKAATPKKAAAPKKTATPKKTVEKKEAKKEEKA